jgi:hypothetical protein
MSEEEAQSSDAPATRAELARWLVCAKGWPLVYPSIPRYADVPPDNPDAPYVETLAAHRISSRLWADLSDNAAERPLFHPEAPLSHADFAEALFLAARDISPLFAELPGPPVWEPGRRR